MWSGIGSSWADDLYTASQEAPSGDKNRFPVQSGFCGSACQLGGTRERDRRPRITCAQERDLPRLQAQGAPPVTFTVQQQDGKGNVGQPHQHPEGNQDCSL